MKQTLYRLVFIGLLLAVLIGSLLPISHPSVSPNDKVNHFVAYAILMISGALAFRTYWKVALFVIAWGVFIEILQGQTAYRMYDMADAVANSGGVALGYIATMLWLKIAPIKQRVTPQEPNE